MKNTYRISVKIFSENIPHAIIRHRWKNNIKMYLQETDREDVGWVNLPQNRVQ
jgi:hypothetical protein